MVQKQKEIEHIELFFATTGALGANVSGLRDAIKEQLSQFLWQIKDKKEPIKIELIHIVKLMHEFIDERANLAVDQKDKNSLVSMVKELRSIRKSAKKKYLCIVVHQDIGDVLRRIFEKDFLARLVIRKIDSIRKKRNENDESKGCTVFLIHSLKHYAEAELLKHLYREHFFLFGAFMPKNQRENRWEYRLKEQKVKKEIIAAQIEDIFKRDYERAEWDWLSDKKKRQKIRKNVKSFWDKYTRVFLKNLPNVDNKKIKNLYQWAQKFDTKHGSIKDTDSWSYFSQNIKTLLPKCDAIIRTFPNLPNDWHKVDLDQLNRVLQLLFGNFHRTPTNDEHGLYMAYSAMLQSGELGRQVGAIVTNEIGDTLAIGYNEVPCFGGLCSEDNFPENRDYLETELTSMRYLKDSIQEIGENFLLFLKDINNPKKNNKKISKGLEVIISKSKFKDSIEHFRSVHAEMGALVNAAKSGVAVKGSTMYVTTFPCHLCIKHIIASGISRVVYLEPYEKSQTEEYYKKSIVLNPDSNEKEKIAEQNKVAKEKSKVIIEHFTGVLPNRYKNLFYYPHDHPRFAKKMSGKPRQWSSQTSDPTFRIHGSFLEETGYKFWESEIIERLKSRINPLERSFPSDE